MTTDPTLSPELLDRLLAGYRSPEDLTGDDGLFRRLKKALIERALGAELPDHLGYEKGDPAGRGTGNSRNGVSAKTVLTEEGAVELSVPRDRAGTFEPQLIAKGQTRFDESVTEAGAVSEQEAYQLIINATGPILVVCRGVKFYLSK